MLISAVYVCPTKGLAGLEAAEPQHLRLAAEAAGQIGVERLILPVLDESLLGKTRTKVRFLDHLIEGMEAIAESKIQVWLIVPALRLLSLDWVPPYLVRGNIDLISIVPALDTLKGLEAVISMSGHRYVEPQHLGSCRVFCQIDPIFLGQRILRRRRTKKPHGG